MPRNALIDRMKGRCALCIFIVDDEPTLGEMAGHLLELQGYKPAVFNDPLKALQRLRSGELPCLLITDYLMDAVNGLELIAEYKRLHPQGRAILLSGTVTEEFLANVPAPPDRFLPKPYSGEDLLRAVEELIGGLAPE